MAGIQIQAPEITLADPVLVEGFPGLGLVGKIATDHLITELEMDHYASVDCSGLPPVGVYRAGDRTARPPVRIYASEHHNVLALQSDTPIGSQAIETVADCVTGWIVDQEATPIYLSGLPAERDDHPAVYGIATGDVGAELDRHEIDAPPGDGVITGPTGALINRTAQNQSDGFGLIVESNPQFPDPEAASALIEDGIAPLADLSIDVTALLDRAEEIKQKRQQFAKQMQHSEESTQAQPLRMYQ